MTRKYLVSRPCPVPFVYDAMPQGYFSCRPVLVYLRDGVPLLDHFNMGLFSQPNHPEPTRIVRFARTISRQYFQHRGTKKESEAKESSKNFYDRIKDITELMKNDSGKSIDDRLIAILEYNEKMLKMIEDMAEKVDALVKKVDPTFQSTGPSVFSRANE